MNILIWLIRLYPKVWRDRYQEEFTAMLEQYDKPRVSDILDVILGAIKAHVQALLQSKKKIQPDLIKGGLEKMLVTEENLDRAHAQKLFEDGIKEHQVPIVFHDVDFAPSFKDQQNTLTFYFYADEKIDLFPLMKQITGVYKQKIQMIQVGKLKHQEKARNYL